MADDDGPLYLGLDLSTQQLKAIIVAPDLRTVARAHVDFDADFGAAYSITKGVLTRPATGEVFAPVALWLESLDLVLERLAAAAGAPLLHRVRGLSAACQQHGSVYWAAGAARALAALDPARPLAAQLAGPDVLAHPWAPNWQDHSTQPECDAFDAVLGGRHRLAEVTGSAAHHRFTGPQIMRLRRVHPHVYANTARISLVSSWLASVLLGRIAPIDASDACGMNLWDMAAARWHPELLALADGSPSGARLRSLLGEPCPDASRSLGPVAAYFAARHGLRPDCQVLPCTGDNPATLLALPLRPGDAVVSLGTSTTLLMHTTTGPAAVPPDPDHHYSHHPTTPGHYMFMLCYKNGGLARERVRDALPGRTWAAFDAAVDRTPPLAVSAANGRATIGLFFNLRETVPNLRAGTWRFTCAAADGSDLRAEEAGAGSPVTDARLVVESQALSMRLRCSRRPGAAAAAAAGLRRVYLVGGGAGSAAVARTLGAVLVGGGGGGEGGVWRVADAGDACARGAAHKALWALERRDEGQPLDALLAERWRAEGAAERVDDDDDDAGEGAYEAYGNVLGAFEEMERRLLAEEEEGLSRA